MSLEVQTACVLPEVLDQVKPSLLCGGVGLGVILKAGNSSSG